MGHSLEQRPGEATRVCESRERGFMTSCVFTPNPDKVKRDVK